MVDKLLALLLLSSTVQPSCKNIYQYNIIVSQESDFTYNYFRSAIVVNGFEVKCFCGKNPIMLSIFMGVVCGYCEDHAMSPVIDLSEVFMEEIDYAE